MHVVYSIEDPPDKFAKSIFLAGPSPRDASHYNWRPEALELLEKIGYDGVVFVPLPRNGEWPKDYNSQVDWEFRCLNMADIVVFWVPRDMKDMPALTTNVEFGMFYDSGKAVLGHPDGAPGMRYLVHHAKLEGAHVHTELEATLRDAVGQIGAGAERSGGERTVPLSIWRLPHFQSWYRTQKAAGNRLDNTRLLWSFRIGKNKQFTFAYVLSVDIFIAAEGRNKTNEFIIARPDISTVVAYHKNSKPEDTEIVLIREFRSAARTADGFIHEVPGGSTLKENEEMAASAAEEFQEETGFAVDPARLRKVGERQLNGTLSTHQAHVFAYELTEKELGKLRGEQASGVDHGVAEDTERTHVEIHRLGDLLDHSSNSVDWSMVGMILAALN